MQIKTPIGFLLSHVRLSQYLYLPHFEMLASAVMVSDSVGFMFLKYNVAINGVAVAESDFDGVVSVIRR